METLQTITQVTKALGISTRTLRYYEQLGLLQSKRMEGYSYRTYDEEACLRLKQILVLRKLRIPLSQIAVLLSEPNGAVEIFMRNIRELNEEIASLSVIRDILQRFADELRESSDIRLKTDLLSDETLLSMLAPLSLTKPHFKEEKSMEDLKTANEKLSKLTDKDVRIVYLPPATVAAYQFEGDEPEKEVNCVINDFVLKSGLTRIKPDMRNYGFNNPNPTDETGRHGYEIWVTIPDDMDIPAPLVKKQFEGGLYAAHMIPFGAFEEWEWLNEWVSGSDKYDYRGNWDNASMFGWLEEHLNYINHVALDNPEPEGMQLDLLIPVKEKPYSTTCHPDKESF